MAPRERTPPTSRASGEKHEVPPSPGTPGVGQRADKKARDLLLSKMYETNWAKLDPADPIPQVPPLTTVHMTPELANTTASSPYGPFKAPTKTAGDASAPYRFISPTPGAGDDPINSAQRVTIREGLDAELGVHSRRE